MSVKTLIVDDEISLLDQAKIFLNRASEKIDVSTVSSAEKALDMMEAKEFDVIVSDYQMPEINGLEFLEKIREGKNSDIPFIMFTGKGREDVAMKALNLGADRYIKKEGNPKDQFEFLAHAIIRENEQFDTKIEKEEREKKIKKLYQTSIELGNYNSEREIYQHVLDSFKEILYFEASSICIGEEGRLVVKATDAKNVEIGEKRSNDEGIRGLTYQNQKSYLIDDLSKWDEAQPSDPDFKSALSIPIKNEGVYQALSTEKNYFDEFDIEMAEMLISHMWQVIEGIRYQDELKKNRIWLSQVIENSSVPTFVIDKNHKVTHWNKACENLTGIPKDEIIGTKKAWKAFYYEERPVMADLILKDVSEDGIKKYYGNKFWKSPVLPDAYEAEDFFSKFDEEGKWIYFTAAPIKDDEENIVGAIETLKDITERKKHEQELKNRNEKIKRLHGEVTDFGKCESEEEICDLVIQASEKILDFEVCGVDFVEEDEFIPKTFSTEIEDGFIRRKVEDAGISRKVYEDKESLVIEDRRDIDFSKPVVSDYRSSLTIPMGDFGIYQALSTEIGAFDEKDLELAEILVNHASEAITRLNSEEELKRSKEKVEKLHKASAELEGCQSEEEVYSYALDAAEEILEFDMCGFDAVEGDKFVVKATSSDIPDGGYVDMKMEEGGIATKTYLNRKSYLIGDLSKYEDAKPAKSDYESLISVPIGEYGIFQAVSTEINHFDEEDLKMAELLIDHVKEALKRIEMKGREEFLHSLLRHDVGNKAQITQGYLQLMEEHDPPKELKENLEKARKATENGIEVIEKVRKLRNIENKDKLSEMDLASIIDDVISRFEAQLQEKDISIEREKCNFSVQGDPLLEELFSNLIENSIRHSDCDEIRVRSRLEEDDCIVSVEDDGVGISNEAKEKIFERGFTEGENGGTGLGLYMVKEIARSYGGNVEVKESDMGGARFDVRLKRS